MKIIECTKCKGVGVIETKKNCTICNGTGNDPKRSGVRCANCIGWGVIGYFYPMCEDCNGKGYRDWVDEMRRPLI